MLHWEGMFFAVNKTKCQKATRSRRCTAAFTLIEVVVAMMLSVLALTAFYASSGQAVRIVKRGKETALASQLLQERIEALRSAPRWASVTTPDGVRTLITNATVTAANFPGATETVTVAAYPAGGTPFVVTRAISGSLSSSGSSLSAEKCVKLTLQVSWSGVGGTTRSRQIATLITKGGL